MATGTVALQVYGRTDIGKVRGHNEDAFVIADLEGSRSIDGMTLPIEVDVGPRGVLLAVSDGLGGAQAGEVASALALEALDGELRAGTTNGAEKALVASVELSNRKVWEAAKTTGRTGMGATLTAMLIRGRHAYVAEIGDSRAYLLRGTRLIQLTRDQSCVQVMLDRGALTPAQAERFPNKHLILQAIGTTPNVVVALDRFSLRQGDRLLLCSDGLTGAVTDEELRTTILSASHLDAACTCLIDLANARGGVDNVTVIIGELTGDGLPRFSGEERVSLENVQAFTG